MEKLFLENNKLTNLPKSIFELTSLEILSLENNKLTDLPESIFKLINLEKLFLENNQLTDLPESISELSNLQELDLSNNQLSGLPFSIEKLTNLIKLDLEKNQLTELPEIIGNLSNLQTLVLESNQLTRLPESITSLDSLTSIYLHNNQFQVGLEVYGLPIKELLNEILKWQKAQEQNKLKPIHEAKVIFIGQSDYGKSHLIELLRNGKIKRDIPTTHGIERNKLMVKCKNESICLNLWDLGGQGFMRNTHQFFFSERTLYVLVTLARRERNELNHWLKLVNQLGNNAPVLIVINKIDLDSHDLDRMSLQRDYPNIIGFVRTSIKDNESIEKLLEQIKGIVSDKEKMPSVFEQRRPEWFTVKKGLENLEVEGKDYISYEEYERLEHVKDLPPDERKSNLKLLSILGTVVSYVDDPRLIDTNVINPQWIMDGVYAIINDPIVKDQNKGQFHIDDLSRILNEKRFPKNKHNFLLELLQKFNLCYPTKNDRNFYFIPDLFEDVEPEVNWNAENTMHFRYNYDDFPPNTFMTKFIVDVHEGIIDKNRWRSGVYISNDSCKAKVYQGFRRNIINIEILGDLYESRKYLYSIREVFRTLHKPFSNMKMEEEIYYKDQWIGYQKLEKFESKNKPFYHEKLDEDIPVTEILNGYRKENFIESTSQKKREKMPKKITIFLASSFELKPEREQFEIFINRENKRLHEQDVFINLEIWEDFIDAMSQTRLQDEYNKVVKQSDIFVSLFFSKVGKFTAEEFETAIGQFKKNGKPFVYTYFKDAPMNPNEINQENINSLFEFKKKLKELGHFETTFKNIDDLKYNFKMQLEKVLPLL